MQVDRKLWGSERERNVATEWIGKILQGPARLSIKRFQWKITARDATDTAIWSCRRDSASDRLAAVYITFIVISQVEVEGGRELLYSSHPMLGGHAFSMRERERERNAWSMDVNSSSLRNKFSEIARRVTSRKGQSHAHNFRAMCWLWRLNYADESQFAIVDWARIFISLRNIHEPPCKCKFYNGRKDHQRHSSKRTGQGNLGSRLQFILPQTVIQLSFDHHMKLNYAIPNKSSFCRYNTNNNRCCDIQQKLFLEDVGLVWLYCHDTARVPGGSASAYLLLPTHAVIKAINLTLTNHLVAAAALQLLMTSGVTTANANIIFIEHQQPVSLIWVYIVHCKFAWW